MARWQAKRDHTDGEARHRAVREQPWRLRPSGVDEHQVVRDDHAATRPLARAAGVDDSLQGRDASHVRDRLTWRCTRQSGPAFRRGSMVLEGPLCR